MSTTKWLLTVCFAACNAIGSTHASFVIIDVSLITPSIAAQREATKAAAAAKRATGKVQTYPTQQRKDDQFIPVVLGTFVWWRRKTKVPKLESHLEPKQQDLPNEALQQAPVVNGEGGVDPEPGRSGWHGHIPHGRVLEPTVIPAHIEARRKDFIVGEVRFFNESKQTSRDFWGPRTGEDFVWTFRVYAEEDGKDGVDIYMIEMRSKHFSGTVVNGDRVAFARKRVRKDGKPIRLTEIINLSAGASLVSVM